MAQAPNFETKCCEVWPDTGVCWVPASNRGQGSRNHTESCRAGMEESTTQDGDPRIIRYNQRIVEASAKFMAPDGERKPDVHEGDANYLVSGKIAREDTDTKEAA